MPVRNEMKSLMELNLRLAQEKELLRMELKYCRENRPAVLLGHVLQGLLATGRPNSGAEVDYVIRDAVHITRKALAALGE